MFKGKAAKIEKAIKTAYPDTDVHINVNKPRKGAFVVSIEGEDQPRIELLDMPRPFQKLRNYDLDTAINEIIEALK